MKGLGHFMLFFGLISTIFDLLLFFTVLRFLAGDEIELRTLWFIASLVTEAIAIYTLRTSRRAWQSTPSSVLGSLTILIVILAFLLPSLGLFSGIGIASPSLPGVALIVVLALGYLIAIEFGKTRAKTWATSML
jgi:Mg2+-importing ATPase